MSQSQKDDMIDPSNLSGEQLQYMKQNLEQEIGALGDSYSGLKMALSRFESSKESIDSLGSTPEGTPLMVPLTSALYVHGTVGNATKVMVDIGTGFFVEKDIKGAQDYTDRKIAAMKSNLQYAQQALMAKRADLQAITAALQIKIQQMRMQQGQQ